MKSRLEAIARRAGDIILAHEIRRIDQKEGHANFVTSVDQAVQEELVSALTALLPGSRIIGEEKENDSLTDAYTWIIDPVDGTTNLIHDYRFSAVSIALLKNRKPVIGLIYQPYTKELFYAEAGRGAYLNGERIHTADHPIETALIAFGTSPYQAELAQKSMRIAHAFLLRAADIRRTGSAALDLAYVACGRVDAFFELTLKPWDYAAGALLIEEAGGRFDMPLSKTGLDYGSSQAVLAGSAACFEDVRSLMLSFF